MKRFGWFLLVLAVSVAGAAFRWLGPRGNEFSIVEIDVDIGGLQNQDAPPLPPVHTVDDGPAGLSMEFDTSAERSVPKAGCFNSDLIRGARVVALGAYEGGEPLSLAFAGDGDEVTRIAVQGNEVGPPLLLVVNAYDPVVWDFAGFPTHRLRAVLVYGHSDQAVAHVEQSIPVRFVTRAAGQGQCGTALLAYKQSSELPKLRRQIRDILGVPMNAFYGSYSPDALQVDGASYKTVRPTKLNVASLRASGPLQDSGLMPAEQGIRQLIELGDLRPAKASDWAQWNRVSGEKPDTFPDGYVVLRRTTLPRGMYGAHSRAFIIPAGVPIPTDPGSHNRYYLLKDGSCLSCL